METVWRVAVVYLFLMVAVRTIGKRDVGQLAPFDLIILLLIPELVAAALVGEDYSLTNGFIGVATLLLLVFATSVITHLNRDVDRVVDGRPTVLVHRGKLMEDAMNLERVGPDQVIAQMHSAGLDRLSQVKWGILETDGKISFVAFEANGPEEGGTSTGPF